MGTKFTIAFAALIATLSIAPALAESCSSEAKKNEQGAYTGCQVKMSGKEFLIGSESSSESGCKFVCAIMGEVNDTLGKGKKTGQLSASAR